MRKLTANEAFKSWLMCNNEERETWMNTMEQLYKNRFIPFATYFSFQLQIRKYLTTRNR